MKLTQMKQGLIKPVLLSVASAVMALSVSVHAEDMPGMKMDGMEGMQMKPNTAQAPVAGAEGVIKALDNGKHTVTISHGAVPAVQWPAMTMAFAATTDQVSGLAVGDRVAFKFQLDGPKATIVSIAPMK